MKDTLVLFSTDLEAEDCLSNFSLKSIPSEKGLLYEGDFGFLLITGMGSLNTLSSLYNLPFKPSFILSLGVAGSLSDNLAIGEIYEAGAIHRYLPPSLWKDNHMKNFHQRLYSSLNKEHQGLSIVSSDFPIHELQEKKLLAKHFQLVDMESYAIGHYCQQENVDFKIIKAISDTPSENASNGEIPKRLKKLSKSLTTQLTKHLTLT
jgi:nucleoside phosphorylase